VHHSLLSARLCVDSRSIETVGVVSPQRVVCAQSVPFGQVLYDELVILVLYKQWKCMQGGAGWWNDRRTPPRFWGKKAPDEETFLASTIIGLHEFSWNKISWRSEPQMLNLCRKTTCATGEPVRWRRDIMREVMYGTKYQLRLPRRCQQAGPSKTRWACWQLCHPWRHAAQLFAPLSADEWRCQSDFCTKLLESVELTLCVMISCFNFLCSTVKSASWSVLVALAVDYNMYSTCLGSRWPGRWLYWKTRAKFKTSLILPKIWINRSNLLARIGSV
jgi:hypothetical protein